MLVGPVFVGVGVGADGVLVGPAVPVGFGVRYGVPVGRGVCCPGLLHTPLETTILYCEVNPCGSCR